MVYKRYIKKGGKLYGPYTYESKRINGKVVSRFIGISSEISEQKPLTTLTKLPINKPNSLLNKQNLSLTKANSQLTKQNLPLAKTKVWNFDEPKKPNFSEFNKFNKFNNHYNFKPLLAIVFGILLIVLMFFAFSFFTPSGRITLQIEPSYQLRQTISGNFVLVLKQGELIPADSVLQAKLNNQKNEIVLADLISAGKITGDFYADNIKLDGSGEGYGIEGEKVFYPDVDFTMKIVEKEESEAPTETPTETPGETPTETPTQETPTTETPTTETSTTETSTTETPTQPETPTETPTETLIETTPTQETPPTSETTTESSGSESASSTLITGEVISESGIVGVVSKNSPYTYTLEQGQTAQIVSSSHDVEITVKDNVATITTNYSETEKGFGSDYLTDSESKIVIDISKLGIKAEQGLLKVSLTYQDKEIVSAKSDIDIEKPEKENKTKEEKEIKNKTIKKKFIQTNITTTVNATGNLTIETLQYGAVVGMPVKWKKIVNLGGDNINNLTINLPKDAENITIYKIAREVVVVSQIIEVNETIEEGEVNETAGETGINESETIPEIIPEENITEQVQINETINEVSDESESAISNNTGEVSVNEPNPAVTIETTTENQPSTTTDTTNKEEKQENKGQQTKGNTQELEIPGASNSGEFKVKEQIITGKAITGKISAEIKLAGEETTKKFNLIGFFRNIFSRIAGGITGRTITTEETPNNTQVVIENLNEENISSLEIEYETSAPLAFEKSISSTRKQIIVSGPDELHYTNVLAYAELPQNISISKIYKVKLYWITNASLTNESAMIENATADAITEDNNLTADEINATINESISNILNNSEPSVSEASNISNETSSPSFITGGITGSAISEINSSESSIANESSSETINETIANGIDETPANEIIATNILPKVIALGDGLVKQQVEFIAVDENNDFIVDYVEWVVPQLSNQTYEIIIEISGAEHLDENRSFIADIYDLVKAQDDNWTNPVNESQYVRVTFAQELDKTKDITVYARAANKSAVVNGTEIPYEIYQKKLRIDEIRRQLGI